MEVPESPVPTRQSHDAPFGVVTDDGAPRGPGQIGRTQFIEQISAESERAADEELAATGRTARDCPYLAHWLRFYRDQPAAHIERVIQHYARPERTDLAGLSAAVSARVRIAVKTWIASSGRVIEAPAGIVGSGEDDRAGEESGDGGVVNRKATEGVGGSTAPAPASDLAAVRAQLKHGHPLDGSAAARLGGALGEDFGGVVVHTDPQAERLAGSLGARAFTVGTHVAFAAGQYRPGTVAGDALLAHELAHVVQQRAAATDRADRRRSLAEPREHEEDADRAALGAMARLYRAGSNIIEALNPRPSLRLGLSLQRCKKDKKPGPRIGFKDLAKGRMTWKLEGIEADPDWAAARMQVSFAPKTSSGPQITFLQTVVQSSNFEEAASKQPRIDVHPHEFEPFYGADWDPTAKQWGPESAPEGYKNAPSNAEDRTAYLFDEPFAPPTQVKMFETVAVVPGTGETLGALRWGLGGGAFFGAGDDDCTEQPSASFAAALETFYATPATLGPEPRGSRRKERYDAILDRFAANDSGLTVAHKAQLDPIATKLKADPDLGVVLGGFADATEKDPGGIATERAKAVKKYLVDKGVGGSQVKISGFAATWARYPSSATEDRNRRVQVTLYRPDKQEPEPAPGGGASGSPPSAPDAAAGGAGGGGGK